jgi:hypothetical protein
VLLIGVKVCHNVVIRYITARLFQSIEKQSARVLPIEQVSRDSREGRALSFFALPLSNWDRTTIKAKVGHLT